MANIAIDPFNGDTDNGHIQNPVRGVQTIDLKSTGAQLDSDDTVIIDVEYNDDVIIFIHDTGGGAVVTVAAGDNPPSPLAGLGAVALTVPDADMVAYVPAAGRHVQDDGKIYLTSTQQVYVWAMRAPAGFVGVGQMNRTSIPAAPTN